MTIKLKKNPKISRKNSKLKQKTQNSRKKLKLWEDFAPPERPSGVKKKPLLTPYRKSKGFLSLTKTFIHISQTQGVLTTSSGLPVDDLTNSISAGERGPLVLQDLSLIDTLAHFDRERIPERVVHAKGAGAFGYFEVTHDITDICKVRKNQKKLNICTVS